MICNPSKIDEKGCHGAPDWIIEIVSPSSERMDYVVKTFKYQTAGVREYWVIDKPLQKVTVFDFENDKMFEYDFTQKIPVAIYNGTSVHNGFMKNSGFIGSYTHFSLAHL